MTLLDQTQLKPARRGQESTVGVSPFLVQPLNDFALLAGKGGEDALHFNIGLAPENDGRSRSTKAKRP